MKNLFLIILISSCFFSCSKKDKKPDYVLSEKKMISFLIDMHIAEARINDLSLKRDSAENLFHMVEDSLYRKHGIPGDSVYQKSYEYYLRDVEGMDKIYQAVVDSLSLRERLSNPEKN